MLIKHQARSSHDSLDLPLPENSLRLQLRYTSEARVVAAHRELPEEGHDTTVVSQDHPGKTAGSVNWGLPPDYNVILT